jgi:RNA polymerase sigma-70 factor, ECF subfamily
VSTQEVSTQGAEERALVARLRSGDEAAYEQVVREQGGRMLSVARRLLRDEDEARDAVQEAFLAAFRSIGTFAGESRYSTWLHRIVVNTALMRLRRRKTRNETSIEALLPTFNAEGGFTEKPRAWGEESSVQAEREEDRLAVRAAIEKLPETYRTVLLLRDVEGLSTDEAAAVLGVTPNATKVRLHRAHQALKSLLDDRFSEAKP